MSIIPFYFLIGYLVGVAAFIILALLNVYHILRFSFLRAISIVTTFVFIGLSVVIIFLTLNTLGHIDWQQPIEVSLPFTDTIDEEFE